MRTNKLLLAALAVSLVAVVTPDARAVVRGGGGAIRYPSGGAARPSGQTRQAPPARQAPQTRQTRQAPPARQAQPAGQAAAAQPAAPLRQARPAASAQIQRPVTRPGLADSTYRPANCGSITGQTAGAGASRTIVGPNGGSAGIYRGPGGVTAGYIKGPEGAGVAGVRTRYGAAAVARLPDGSIKTAWRGNDYWYNHGYWYAPCWYDDQVWYQPVYPPEGYWTSTAPWENEEAVTPVVVNNNTYYQYDDAYYEKTTQNGQEGYQVVPDPNAPPAPPVPAVTATSDPLDTLKAGLSYLASLSQFTMTVTDSYDELTQSGQKVSFSSQRTIFVRRPDNVSIQYSSDTDTRRVIFDGLTCTFLDLKKDAYGQAHVPGTIDAALDKLAQDYGIAVPIAELLRTNLYVRMAPKIQSIQYIGSDMIAGGECSHLGFTTEDRDVEVWVALGNQPLIRKVSISYPQVPARPRYTMRIESFDTSAVPNEAFAYAIPMGATKVDMAFRVANPSVGVVPAR